MSDEYVNKTDKNANILVQTGNEGSITDFWDSTGFIKTLARETNSYLLQIEHRYQGTSLPFGPNTTDNNSPDRIKQLTTNNTLLDFVHIIEQFKHDYSISGKVIAFGGSYGGMLSAQLKIKQPNVIQGSIASSAPVQVENDYQPYQFTEIVQDAYDKQGLSVKQSVDALTSMKLDFVNENFSNYFCDNNTSKLTDLHSLYDVLDGQITYFVQYGQPEKLESNEIVTNYQKLNNQIKQHNFMHWLNKLMKQNQIPMVTSLIEGVLMIAGLDCLDIKTQSTEELKSNLWQFQSCSQQPFQFACGEKCLQKKEIQEKKFEKFEKDCKTVWNIQSDIKFTEQEYQFNIKSDQEPNFERLIFTNGTFDPWSYAGQYKNNIANDSESILIEEGAHHSELRLEDPELDSDSLKDARFKIRKYIEKWLLKDEDWVDTSGFLLTK